VLSDALKEAYGDVLSSGNLQNARKRAEVLKDV
jgi:hypothetical protein